MATISAVALFAAGGGAAAASLAGGGPPAARPRRAPAPVPVIVGLAAYDGCSQLLSDLKAQALKDVGPYGLANYSDNRDFAAAGPTVSASLGAPTAAPALSASGAAAPQPFSTTNDQEVGADEPDLVKTDGHILAALRQNPATLEVADVSGSTPHLDGSLALPALGYSSAMFLVGGDAVVLGQGQQYSPAGPSTVVTVVSLADPAHPAVERSFNLSGSEVGARLIGGRVEVVLQQGPPRLPFVYPSDQTPASQAAATAHNRAVIEASTLSDWLPTLSAGDCAGVFHPEVDSGLGAVSVVPLDPSSDTPGREVTVVGDASTVYASADRLYLATGGGDVHPPEYPLAGPAVAPGLAVSAPAFSPTPAVTAIHAFDLSDPSNIGYLGSASVPGRLIGQYALSDYQGYLRVATTIGQATPAPGEGDVPADPSDSRITILEPKAGSLVTVGSITGLGTGEKIYGVRFEGPLAYVVTFRQTDPLYIVDLTDPAHPELRGQLALTGFSSFLQPLDGSLLLGIGQGVDSNLRQTGLQLSVFDVSNPQLPALRSRVDMGESFTDAGYDPHALLWWPARRLVAMPVSGPDSPIGSLMVWHVGSDGTLRQVADLDQPGAVHGSGIERAVVVGDLLYSISDGGIMATGMNFWNQSAWLPFA